MERKKRTKRAKHERLESHKQEIDFLVSGVSAYVLCAQYHSRRSFVIPFVVLCLYLFIHILVIIKRLLCHCSVFLLSFFCFFFLVVDVDVVLLWML